MKKKEIKVGDKVIIHKPENRFEEPGWEIEMDIVNGRVCNVVRIGPAYISIKESDYLFNPDWCSPVEDENRIKEIVETLNERKICQKSMSFVEDLDKETYREYFSGDLVEEELDIEKHRWYETSLSVWKVGWGFIGVRSVTGLYSEQSSVGDICYTLEFYEMESIPTVTYKIKK